MACIWNAYYHPNNSHTTKRVPTMDSAIFLIPATYEFEDYQ